MARQSHAGHERRGYWGKILVSLGTVALLADLSVLARPIEVVAARLEEGLFSLVPTLGLSFLSTAREIVFHQFDYFSLVARILVLFTAVLAIVIGAMALNARPAATTREQHSFTLSLEGDR